MSPRPARDLDAFPVTPTWLAWLETSALTAGAPRLGVWLQPADPMFLHAPFSWPVIAPLVAGLRYGFAYGFGCALALCLGLVGAWRWQWFPLQVFPGQYAVALLVIGMVAGEFCDMWTRRLRRLELVNDYRRDRLNEFTRAYHILKVSHDHLEQRIAGATHSLREAVVSLRRELLSAQKGAPPLFDLETQILGLFTSYGWMQVALLYAAGEDRRLRTPAAARLGDAAEVPPSDPMLREALERGRLVSVRADSAGAGERGGSELLAAIPVVDVHGRVWAVLAVREMLFIAFHEENLRLLAVIGGYVGDVLATSAGRARAGSSPWEELRFELARCIEDRRRHDLPSIFVTMEITLGAAAGALAEQMVSERRGLDQMLLVENARHHPVVFLLMPLTAQSGVEGYFARLQKLARGHGAASLTDAATLHWHAIQPDDQAGPLLAQLQRRSAVEVENDAGREPG